MPVPVDIRSVSLGQEVESSGGMEYHLIFGYFFERRPRDRWELMRPIVCVERPPASILRLLLVGFGGEVGSVGSESPVDFLFPFERIPSLMLNGRHPGVLSVSLAQQSPFPTAAWMSLPASLGPVFRLGGMARHGERQMVGPWRSLFPCRGVS